MSAWADTDQTAPQNLSFYYQVISDAAGISIQASLVWLNALNISEDSAALGNAVLVSGSGSQTQTSSAAWSLYPDNCLTLALTALDPPTLQLPVSPALALAKARAA